MNTTKTYSKYKEQTELKGFKPISKQQFTAVFYAVLDIATTERQTMKKINGMCEESLSPVEFEKWESVKYNLQENRKELKNKHK